MGSGVDLGLSIGREKATSPSRGGIRQAGPLAPQRLTGARPSRGMESPRAHFDPEQVQCGEAFGGPHGSSSLRLMALDFWKSPATLYKELPAWGSILTCTTSTFLLEALTSPPAAGGSSLAPGPHLQPTHGFGTCFIHTPTNGNSLGASPCPG